MSKHIQSGETEQITQRMSNTTGLTDVLLSIRRKSDGKYLDFDDLTYKSTGWVTRQFAMLEVSASYAPGLYYYDFATTVGDNKTYDLIIECASYDFYNHSELVVGGWLDYIDASITSRLNIYSIKKNTAKANFEFPMVDSSDDISPKTGLTVTAERSIDGGVFAPCTNAVTELSNGIYKISLSASDLNGDVIMLKFTGSGANATLITIVTES